MCSLFLHAVGQKTMRANRRVDAHSALLSRSCSAESHCSPLPQGSRQFLSEAAQNCHFLFPPLPEVSLPPVRPTKSGSHSGKARAGRHGHGVTTERSVDFFLMQSVAGRCRMSKRFSQEAGSGADPEIPTPRRDKLFEGYSLQGGNTIRMQGDALHLEWIRDSSTP